jgi:hypothetical protein
MGVSYFKKWTRYSMSLVSTSSKIVGGSALAGFGIAFGRDIYKGTKKNKGQVLFLIVAIASLFTVYFSSMWIFRNYRTVTEGAIKRLGALALFIPGYYLAFLCLYILISILAGLFHMELEIIPDVNFVIAWKELLGDLFLYLVGSEGSDNGNVLNTRIYRKIWLIDFSVLHLVIFFGALSGLAHRKKRRQAWIAEDHNRKFLAENGIEELDDTHFRDRSGNRYRLENIFASQIELFAEGRRNKRAYISVDSAGKFTAWSGIVSIA